MNECKNYAVVYQNLDTERKKVNVTTFFTKSESSARSDFHECYRHARYRILAVVEVPEIEEEK